MRLLKCAGCHKISSWKSETLHCITNNLITYSIQTNICDAVSHNSMHILIKEPKWHSKSLVSLPKWCHLHFIRGGLYLNYNCAPNFGTFIDLWLVFLTMQLFTKYFHNMCGNVRVHGTFRLACDRSNCRWKSFLFFCKRTRELSWNVLEARSKYWFSSLCRLPPEWQVQATFAFLWKVTCETTLC